jgi:hypothetical protein
MLVADPGPTDVTAAHRLGSLVAIVAVVHVDFSIEDHKDLLTVVDMPPVRCVGPVQPDRRGLLERDGFNASETFSAVVLD